MQDCERGWNGLLASAFDADWTSVAVSGAGVNWDAVGKESPMFPHFGRVGKDGELKATEISASNGGEDGVLSPPDAVFLFLGGNDFIGLNGKLSGSEADSANVSKFQDQYVASIGKIREVRGPTVPIVCLVAGEQMMSSCSSKESQAEHHEVQERLIPPCVERAGGPDAKVYLLRMGKACVLDFEDDTLYGALGHWSVKGHLVITRALVQQCEELLGWQAAPGWDQVDLSDLKFSRGSRRGRSARRVMPNK